MRYRDGRRSVCLSSQSGCPLTCTFCATGQMKFGRNLSADEILDQALHFRRIEAIDHVVFMGMGEPTMNIDNVLAACERLPDLGVTHRRTAISTVGWVPGIDRLAECEMPVSLALSLHAPNDGLRSQLMPVNDRYPLAEVLAACDRYRAAPPPQGLRRVRDARRRQRPARARPRTRRPARPARLQGQPDPLQPDRQPTTAPRRSGSSASARSSPSTASPPPSASPAAATSTPPAASSPPRPGSTRSMAARKLARNWRSQLGSPRWPRSTPPRPSHGRRRCPPTRCGGWSETSSPSGGERGSSRPGRGDFSLARTHQIAHDPLPLLLGAYEEHGPIFSMRLLHSRVVFMLGPEANHFVTVGHPENFHWRESSFGDLIPLLGDGLLTIDDDYHDRARAIMMPAFHREQIVAAVEAMAVEAERGDRRAAGRRGRRHLRLDAQPGDADRDAGAARPRPRRGRQGRRRGRALRARPRLLRDRLPPAAAARAAARPGAR